ncbi:MAG: hypothetical protein NUV56_02905 [Candidatus Uhrbacteria bacterium]|nr:hypothetical protein [Candidatus Uhrbacteria bacterium]
MNTSEKEDVILLALATCGVVLVLAAVIWVTNEVRGSATAVGLEQEQEQAP